MEKTEILTMREGVLLTHALVAFVAAENNIRILSLKGPGVVIQGLRAHHQSTDADVLIESGMFTHFLALIESRGWTRRPSDPDGSRFPTHSVTLYHTQWPNDIDVHRSIPGLEADSEVVFNVFWRDRELVRMANQDIMIPGLEASRLVLVLHCLRGIWNSREKREYEYLLNLGLPSLESFLSLCTETKALAAARPFISAQFGDDELPEWPKPSPEWQFMTTARTGGQFRLQALRKTSLHRIPRTIWRDLFPPKEVLLLNDLYADISIIGILRAYRKRLKRALKQLRK